MLDGTTSFSPKAIVQLALPDFVSRQGLQVVGGEDGLDCFSAVPMALRVGFRKPVKFAVWRHLGNPEGTLAIHFGPPDMQEPGLLELVLRDLAIPDTAVIRRGPDRPVASRALAANGTLKTPVEENVRFGAYRVVEEVSLRYEPETRLTTGHRVDQD